MQLILKTLINSTMCCNCATAESYAEQTSHSTAILPSIQNTSLERYQNHSALRKRVLFICKQH